MVTPPFFNTLPLALNLFKALGVFPKHREFDTPLATRSIRART